MGSETEPKPKPEINLTSFPNLTNPQQYSGALTPLHSLASVPFSWEKEPGKPLPCLTLALSSSHHNAMKCLELPPRLLSENKMTKIPSPRTVLEGPYIGRSSLQSSSFRFLRKKRKSFDGELSFSGSAGNSPERSLLGNNTVVINSNSDSNKKDKGFFGSWRKKGGGNYKGKSEVHGGSFVFPSISDDVTASCCDGGGTDNQLVQAKSHFWATIYGTFKQAIPRRSTRCKKDAL
ncbi:uncharacterized protein At4g00950-like [Silene latifolia]|uniref:uncharacterized protein At4g00950-like n=1 Tax=Silene latifolia TaxID=37657 RepID=UPI003D772986